MGIKFFETLDTVYFPRTIPTTMTTKTIPTANLLLNELAIVFTSRLNDPYKTIDLEARYRELLKTLQKLLCVTLMCTTVLVSAFFYALNQLELISKADAVILGFSLVFPVSFFAFWIIYLVERKGAVTETRIVYKWKKIREKLLRSSEYQEVLTDITLTNLETAKRHQVRWSSLLEVLEKFSD